MIGLIVLGDCCIRAGLFTLVDHVDSEVASKLLDLNAFVIVVYCSEWNLNAVISSAESKLEMSEVSSINLYVKVREVGILVANEVDSRVHSLSNVHDHSVVLFRSIIDCLPLNL
jgi:hypothetical protein